MHGLAQNEPKNIRFLAIRWHSLNRNQWHKPLRNRWHKTNQNSHIQKNEFNYAQFNHKRIKIAYADSNNPNFSFCYSVKLDEKEICELYTNPTNVKFKDNEVLIKIKNNFLYYQNYAESIIYILNELRLVYDRLSRIDIALDGHDNKKIMEYLKRYIRTKTVVVTNENLKINGYAFNKMVQNFGTYTIGSKKYQKVATVYNKANEIRMTGKKYIAKFWEINGLDTTQEIYRFEIQIGYRHLKNYQITSLEQLNDTEFIGSIFEQQVSDWFKLYQVKLNDINNHRKDIAIRKGKEIKLFKWNFIPRQSIGLQLTEIQPNPKHNAKRVVSFAFNQLIDECANNISTTGSTVNFICSVTNNFELHSFTTKKGKHKLAETEKINIETKSLILNELEKQILSNQSIE